MNIDKTIYEKGSFKLESRPGFKGEEDKVILVSSKEKIELKETLYILKALFDNEDIIHPTSKGYDGSRWMKEMVLRLLEGEDPEKIDEEYNQKGKYPGDAKLFDGKQWEKVICETCLQHAYCEKCKKYIWKKKNENSN